MSAFSWESVPSVFISRDDALYGATRLGHGCNEIVEVVVVDDYYMTCAEIQIELDYLGYLEDEANGLYDEDSDDEVTVVSEYFGQWKILDNGVVAFLGAYVVESDQKVDDDLDEYDEDELVFLVYGVYVLYDDEFGDYADLLKTFAFERARVLLSRARNDTRKDRATGWRSRVRLDLDKNRQHCQSWKNSNHWRYQHHPHPSPRAMAQRWLEREIVRDWTEPEGILDEIAELERVARRRVFEQSLHEFHYESPRDVRGETSSELEKWHTSIVIGMRVAS